MRYLPAIALSFLPFCFVHAQGNTLWGIYGSLQATQASYPGIKGAFDIHWHQTHSIGLSIAWLMRSTDKGSADRSGSWFDNSEPTVDNYVIWTLSYGCYLPLARNDKLRLHLKAGIAAGSYQTAENYRLVYHNPGGFGSFGSPYSSYEYDYVSKTLYGVTLNPALEYTPARSFGFTAGAAACINNQRFCIAAECGILFGMVSNRKRAPRAEPAKR